MTIDNLTIWWEHGHMNEPSDFTVTLPDGIPDAAALIAELRAAPEAERPAIIARYPVLSLLAPVPVFAAWLGIDKATIYQDRYRNRTSGSPGWPDEDETILGRKMWRFSSIALHRAALPGRGHNLTAGARAAARKYGD